MAGASLLVFKGGMFNGIIYSFTKFNKKFSKVDGYVAEQISDLQTPSVKNRGNYSITFSLLISGGIMFLFTLMTSII